MLAGGLALWGLCLTGVGVSSAAPSGRSDVIEDHPDGRINWSTGHIEVLGVGTPKVLSPTGSLTERDPYVLAREDARDRLARLLAELQIDSQRRLGGVDDLQPLVQMQLRGFTSETARHFSDGTVHLPAQVSFQWLPGAMAAAEMGVATEQAVAPPISAAALVPGDASPPPQFTPLVVQLEGGMKPAVQIELAAPGGGRRRPAGLPGDPLGAEGVRWIKGMRSAKQALKAGPKPVILKGKAGKSPGVIVLDAKGHEVAFTAVTEAERPGRQAVWVVMP